MDIIYWLLCLLPWLVVVSQKIDTDGIWRNAGLAVVSFGGFIAVIKGDSSVIDIGIFVLLVEKLVFHYSPYCRKQHETNKR